MTDISITKQAAAQRQIDAAIRMLFLHGEDFAAIQTVAAAARTIVKDLADNKGVGHLTTRAALEEMLRDTLASATRSEGKTNALTAVDLETLAWAAAAAGGGIIPESANFKIEDLAPANPEIAAEIDRRARVIESHRQIRKYRNKAANFLKHADKDADKSLKVSEMDVFGTLVHSIDLWMLMNLELTTEMDIYGRWYCGVTAEKPEDFIITKAGPVHLFTFEQQIDFGSYTLEWALRKSGRSTRQFRDDTGFRLQGIKMFCAIE